MVSLDLRHRRLDLRHERLPRSLLWYVIAYLVVVLICLWLGGLFHPTPSDIGWSD